MEIDGLQLATYISRPNRFTIEFTDNNGSIKLAHLHDPGRLKELLIKGSKVLLKYIKNYNDTNRKTMYDVIAVKSHDDWILLNSSYHNRYVSSLIENNQIKPLKGYHVKKPEYTYNNSRLDFLLEDDKNNRLYLEVKGSTLLIDNIAIFPDAPTERGTRHVRELIDIKKSNESSAILILVLHNKAEVFMPNYETDPEFCKTLKQAYDEGVEIIPLHINTIYEENSLKLEVDKVIPIKFK